MTLLLRIPQARTNAMRRSMRAGVDPPSRDLTLCVKFPVVYIQRQMAGTMQRRALPIRSSVELLLDQEP